MSNTDESAAGAVAAAVAAARVAAAAAVYALSSTGKAVGRAGGFSPPPASMPMPRQSTSPRSAVLGRRTHRHSRCQLLVPLLLPLLLPVLLLLPSALSPLRARL